MKESMSFSGNLEQDTSRFLRLHHCPHTAGHCLKVGYEAERLAARFGGDPDSARAAGFLHDISTIIPNQDRIRAAWELNIDVLPEEAAFPMIIHQKLSRTIARDVFGIENIAVLDAIECHTTLKASSTVLDRIVFIADKIEWDQAGRPLYLTELLEQLDVSLEHGVFVYIDYLWSRREQLKVVHPWLAEAHAELSVMLGV
ncbi:HD domain-containing protein [Paenibacillus piri]|uniref:bis(5'-nucleosyl)-tetraphosphatase (symmetrical) n=2 Tax=Paenibacillus piri TaxID=2547395 RepID=A0A4R5KGQ5_9BACL|nr:HD domain-containing protein [Paenibacillus piri]